MEIIGRSYMLITSGSQRVNNWFEYYFIISLYIYIYIYIYIYHVRVVWLWKYQLISNLVIITILLINWFLKKVVFVPNIAWSFVLWFRVSVKGNMNREVDTYTNLIPYTCGTSSHMSTHSWWRQTYWEWAMESFQAAR